LIACDKNVQKGDMSVFGGFRLISSASACRPISPPREQPWTGRTTRSYL
jgi:hypothetical protein